MRTISIPQLLIPLTAFFVSYCGDVMKNDDIVHNSEEIISSSANVLISSNNGNPVDISSSSTPSVTTESSETVSSIVVSSEIMSSTNVSSDISTNTSSTPESSVTVSSSIEEGSSLDDLSSTESSEGLESSSEEALSSSSIGIIHALEPIAITQNEHMGNNNQFVITGDYTEYFLEGDYLKFSGVDFSSGVNTVTLNLALNFSSATIELRVDSFDGQLIGIMNPTSTGAWTTFQDQEFIIEGVSDVHDLYVVAKNSEGSGNLKSLTFSWQELTCNPDQMCDMGLEYPDYTPTGTELIIPREDFLDRLHGFWLAECIANWTGLITEADHGEPPFYTYSDWGTVDQINTFDTWNQTNMPFYNGGAAPVLDFVFVHGTDVWGSDDDTDIEYIYQHIVDINNTTQLTGEQIRDGWLTHMDGTYIWISNAEAYNRMLGGQIPPATGDSWGSEYIDAQLTTEIFGLFAPAQPAVALDIAFLPIQNTARRNAQWISEFYVIMHSLASYTLYHESYASLSLEDKLTWMAEEASKRLPDGSSAMDMYTFVKGRYAADQNNWEATRDAIYERYQLGWGNVPGYEFNGGAEAEINFAASLVSLFYGKGDIKEIIKIGSLIGWDSDNPTATWGGLIGFMLGKEGLESTFGQYDLSEQYWIHRTRRNFPDRTPAHDGEDTFPMMAERGMYIIDRSIIEEMDGGVNLEADVWYIPDTGRSFSQGN